MVFVLQQRGYLVREAGTDRLALSRRLFDLGIRSPSGRQLTSVVLPLMERFSEESGQAAHLVVLSRAQTSGARHHLGPSRRDRDRAARAAAARRSRPIPAGSSWPSSPRRAAAR